MVQFATCAPKKTESGQANFKTYKEKENTFSTQTQTVKLALALDIGQEAKTSVATVKLLITFLHKTYKQANSVKEDFFRDNFHLPPEPTAHSAKDTDIDQGLKIIASSATQHTWELKVLEELDNKEDFFRVNFHSLHELTAYSAKDMDIDQGLKIIASSATQHTWELNRD